MQRFFNTQRFGPPSGFTLTSPCPGIDHLDSGLIMQTDALFGLAFAAAPSPSFNEDLTKLASLTRRIILQQARRRTLPTRRWAIVLRLLVDIRFQVLFHSPSGVLFTFPSRYLFTIGRQRVFSLGGWSPRLPAGFHVSDGTLDPAESPIHFAYRTVTFFGRPFHAV